MKWVYRTLRAVIVTALTVGLLLPALAYVLLSLPAVQRAVRDTATRELTSLLGVDVAIGSVAITPFNRVELSDLLLIRAGTGDTIAAVGTLSAGVNITRLLLLGDIVVTHAEILGLDARISRPTPDGPLNIQPIIDAFAPRDSTKPPTPFDLKVATVVIRGSKARYDVLSAPQPALGRFDPSHIAVTNLRADIALPRLANDDFTVAIRRLAMAERSGLTLHSLSGNFHITATGLTADGVAVDLGSSRLRPADIALSYGSLSTIGTDLRTAPLDLALLPGTRIVPSDLAPILPALQGLDTPVDINAALKGRLADFTLDPFIVITPGGELSLDLRAAVSGLGTDAGPSATVSRLALEARAVPAVAVATRFATLSPKLTALLSQLGTVTLTGSGSASASEAAFDGVISSAAGTVTLDASASSLARNPSVTGRLKATDLDLGLIASRPDLGTADIEADLSAAFAGKLSAATLRAVIPGIEYRGHRFTDIVASVLYEGNEATGSIVVNDPALNIDAEGTVTLSQQKPRLDMQLLVDHADLALLGLAPRYPHHRLSTAADVVVEASSLDDVTGDLFIDYIRFTDPSGHGLVLDDIRIATDALASPAYFDIASELVDGRIEGSYTLSRLPAALKQMASAIFPALLPPATAPDAPSVADAADAAGTDDFTFDFNLHPTTALDSLIKLPVNIVQDIRVDGTFDSASGTAAVNLLAPYIIKGNTMLRNTSLSAELDASADHAALYFTTTAMMRNDHITLTLSGDGSTDALDTRIAWNYNRARRYDGLISLTAAFARDADRRLLTSVALNPSSFSVNDTLWRIAPAAITITPDLITVDSLRVERPGQYVAIDGRVSASPSDSLSLALRDINLDYIFETLAIDNVKFGGDATGDFSASQLLSGNPVMHTDNLHVVGLSYNHSLMGDADIRSRWLNDRRAVTIEADIAQPNGRHSYVDGRIMPMVDSLDFRFDADRIRVGFMQPFMAAFASNVDGYASGKAHLWGSFKLIDMVGDLYADSVSMRIDFTNTVYTASDSVHLTPGRIDLRDVTLRDIYGHTARLNGWLTHEFFKRPRFEFVASDVDDLLVYDVRRRSDDDVWYGRVFANGTARITGEPGVVDIAVNVTTAPRSTFTFELSDTRTAGDYNFITFRDRDADAKRLAAEQASSEPEQVRRFYERLRREQSSSSSAYNLDIAVDVTPQAEVILVMDPRSGDRIRAHGSGSLRLTYSSASEDLRMYGDYTLERGNYNFTLQDIIVKDFNIMSGSAIAFNGDPYAAQLDIKAEYVVNANLSDLDESFLEDKDLNRTNVPVHALMLVTGDMRQPDIGFDISLPTLNSDVDRKVKSIISTDDMMNRQIVYLLTIGRFYTPEYMESTKGSQLFSVASSTLSSTLSSQLSNILGQISDKWSIAPSLRSDKGDFSDVEFDLALRSTLLNNRLILNGNFGYRDKSLNNNSFIGDFDVEYLLNRTGTLRLKAYNRYNDQNYYVKSALTTQGVGVMFRRDFDNFIQYFIPSWNPRKRRPVMAPVAPALPDTSPAPPPATE